MIKKRVWVSCILLFTSFNVYTMDVASEKRALEENWLVAYKNSRKEWKAFNKTRAGLACEAARVMNKKYNSSRTSYLMKRSLRKAHKTSVFNDYVKAKEYEVALRKALDNYDLKIAK